MLRVDQIRLAAHAWDYAVRLSIRTVPEGPEREALTICEERPTATTVRAALVLGRGRPWLPLIESALVEIGIAAIEEVLTEVGHEHRG